MDDEVELWRLINRCVHLKYKFAAVYAADNFPLFIDCQSFFIVNTDKANQEDTHWVLLVRKKEDDLVFADPLGLPIHYKHICDRLSFAEFGMRTYQGTLAETILGLMRTLLYIYCSLHF